MPYCINPNCLQRKNRGGQEICATCSTPLLVQNRYRLINPIQDLKRSKYFEIFEVEDSLLKCTKVLKILKVNREELIDLFRREAQVLSWLEHPGIPAVEPDEYFVFPSEGQPISHCLAMEKVEGENLNLWIKNNQHPSSIIVLRWLRQLTEILEVVHSNNLFHRDIKPSNIIRKPNGQLVLIDFGAVKQTLQVLYGQEESTVLTPGYAAPEQFERQAVPQSDFYALGRTFVHLLTQRHPIELKEKEGRLLWRQYLPSDFPVLLADFIDELMALSVCDRPDSATTIAQRLKEIFNILLVSKDGESLPTLQGKRATILSSKIFQVITGLVGVIFILVSIRIAITQQHSQSSQRIMVSAGEASLLPQKASVEKQAGMKALSRKDYDTALIHFRKSIDPFHDPMDPEARIFLNNARIGSQKSHTIAVSVPLECPFKKPVNTPATTDGSLNSALKILSGAENVQEVVNRKGGINGIPIKLVITCGRDQDSARKAAEEVVKRPEILGVMGSPGSRVALAAEQIYCKKLVVLSPTSGSEELQNCDRHIFRLIPRDIDVAKTLSQNMLRFQRRKAVTFFNSGNLHSQSLTKEFARALSSSGGEVIDKIDLSNPQFNAHSSVKHASKLKADTLVFFSDSRILDQSFQVMKANQHQLPMLGGANIFDFKTLAIGSEHALGMVVATPCNAGIENVQEWRSYLAKDALYIFIEALKKNPTRLGIREAIMAPNFQVTGACGEIRFSASGDRKPPVHLAKIFPGWRSGTGYDFIALP
jgi:eukaryotic-like serine/threonine-protein kinase